MGPIETPTCLEQTGEGRCAAESVPLVRAYRDDRGQRGASRRTPRSDGEPRAALRPASAQNLAPANTLHAGPKTVCPLPADDGGLIGTFHGAAFDGKSLTLERFAYHSVKDHQRSGSVSGD